MTVPEHVVTIDDTWNYMRTAYDRVPVATLLHFLIKTFGAEAVNAWIVETYEVYGATNHPTKQS